MGLLTCMLVTTAMAATAADRPLLSYHTVGETALTEQLRFMFEQISERCWTVGDVWAMLAKYRKHTHSILPLLVAMDRF